MRAGPRRSLSAYLRAHAALSKSAGGVDLVISHVVREVIERGLDSLDRELGRK